MNSKPSLFLVVEDHPETAENNCHFLRELESSAHCIIAETPEQALERLKLEIPELIVVDLQFGKISGEKSAEPGLNLLTKIFEQYQTLNIVVYSNDPLYITRLAREIKNHRGGFAVVDKMQSRNAFIEGAKCALQEGMYAPKQLLREIPLTEREIEVLRLLCKECLKDKSIAKEIKLTLRAVQSHVSNLKVKLGIDSLDDKVTNMRMALCREAKKRKLI